MRNNNDDSGNLTINDANPERQVSDLRLEILELRATISEQRELVLTKAQASIDDAWMQGWYARSEIDDPSDVPDRTRSEVFDAFCKAIDGNTVRPEHKSH